MKNIGFIGGGNMARALIHGLIDAKIYPASSIFVCDISTERLSLLKKTYGISIATDNIQLLKSCDIIVLSVKPQVMNSVLEQLKTVDCSKKLFISIAAGIKIERITSALGQVRVIRTMPNTPALIAEGATALYANELAKNDLPDAMKIFEAVGKAVVVETEALIDAVTAISGSGPAYFFMLMEEMLKTARKLGLSKEIAEMLVLQTAKGAALLADSVSKTESPAELRRKVTSPGGTTQAALEIFHQENISQIVQLALTAARDRARELSN